MAETLTIRLNPEARAVLERAARTRGQGVSSFVRDLAESEARRLRREAIRADGDRVMAYLDAHPEAGAEVEQLGTPLTDPP